MFYQRYKILRNYHDPVVPSVRAFCHAMSVELHEAEEVDQQPPHHGLLVTQRLGGGELGRTKVARHLQCLEVTNS